MSEKFFELFEKLVPASGQATTVQGEVVRSINKLVNDCVSNGLANWDAGYDRLCVFALRHPCRYSTAGPTIHCAGIRTDIEHIQKYGRREDIGSFDLEAAFDRLMQATVDCVTGILLCIATNDGHESMIDTDSLTKSPEPTAVGACQFRCRGLTPRVGGGSALVVRRHGAILYES